MVVATLKRRLYWILGGIVIVLLLLGIISFRRDTNEEVEQLYANASRFSQDLAEAQDAVEQLAESNNPRATELLIVLATRRTSFVGLEIQRTAIRGLARRNVVNGGEVLATLIQPHQSLAIRETAAESLRKVHCSTQCVVTILHYLERVSRGDMNYEDRFRSELPENFQADVRAMQRKEQDAVYSNLYAILRENIPVTLSVLRERYGLGTEVPATFGLELVERLELTAACDLLKETRDLLDLTERSFVAPRSELSVTMDRIRCH